MPFQPTHKGTQLSRHLKINLHSCPSRRVQTRPPIALLRRAARAVMIWLVMFIIVLFNVNDVSRAQETPETSWLDRLKNLSLPSMPDWSKLGESLTGSANAITQQTLEATKLVEELGYKTVLLEVQWALSPISRVRLKSTGLMEESHLEAVRAKAAEKGVLTKLVVERAIAARQLQKQSGFGTVILDVIVSPNPAIKTCFLTEVINNDTEIYFRGCFS
jgi:hypothetical protein